MSKRDDLQIVPGRNRWIVQRTDRDGASLDAVRSTALVVLRRWLQNASPVGMRAVFQEHGESFAIGAARELTLEASQERPTFEEAAKRQSFADCRIVRVVNAQAPWWLLVRFVWQGGAVRRAWPRLSVNAIGVEDDNDQALDWLLIDAASDAAQIGKVS